MPVSVAVRDAFAVQIAACRKLGSPFTATLLEVVTAEMEKAGLLAQLIGDWSGDPVADALPLRLAGALHALVLSGRAADLSTCYPDGSGNADLRALPTILPQVIENHADHIGRYLAHPPQTNETLRSAVLIGGFTTLAVETKLPLRLLEIGASAGLNTIWDKYRYQLGTTSLGPADSPVLLTTDWQGAPPPLRLPAILSRTACDRSPIDLRDPAQGLRLRSYIWADQRARLARLEAAIDLALHQGVTVEQADAGTWLAQKLAEVTSEAVTVIYHSIMWQYMPAATQQHLQQLMMEAGAWAPVAWLRFEPAGSTGPFELRLTLWCDGMAKEQLLATAHPHGTFVHWHGGMTSSGA